mmetsp:Transcript_65902/g.176588  ORF Transcript_65902/g.176588 Transcript_65902/m.176588 type:complete len:417 (+) Transcript_65902:406-1656(+)
MVDEPLQGLIKEMDKDNSGMIDTLSEMIELLQVVSVWEVTENDAKFVMAEHRDLFHKKYRVNPHKTNSKCMSKAIARWHRYKIDQESLMAFRVKIEELVGRLREPCKELRELKDAARQAARDTENLEIRRRYNEIASQTLMSLKVVLREAPAADEGAFASSSVAGVAGGGLAALGSRLSCGGGAASHDGLAAMEKRLDIAQSEVEDLCKRIRVIRANMVDKEEKWNELFNLRIWEFHNLDCFEDARKPDNQGLLDFILPFKLLSKRDDDDDDDDKPKSFLSVPFSIPFSGKKTSEASEKDSKSFLPFRMPFSQSDSQGADKPRDLLALSTSDKGDDKQDRDSKGFLGISLPFSDDADSSQSPKPMDESAQMARVSGALRDLHDTMFRRVFWSREKREYHRKVCKIINLMRTRTEDR